MASGPQFQAELASSEGLPTAALARDFAELRDNNLIPTKKPFEVEHVVRAMLSRVARRPREIAGVVPALELLPLVSIRPSNTPSPGQSLGLVLASVIEGIARRLSCGEILDDDDMQIINTWNMQICLNPLQASISMEDKKGILSYSFGDQEASLPPLVRLTWITGGIILSMARLLADTYINANAIAAIQFLDRTNPAKVRVASNENADASPKVPASVTNQSPAKGSDALTSSDTSGGFAFGKAPSRDGTGHDSNLEPDLLNPSGSVRCLTST